MTQTHKTNKTSHSSMAKEMPLCKWRTFWSARSIARNQTWTPKTQQMEDLLGKDVRNALCTLWIINKRAHAREKSTFQKRVRIWQNFFGFSLAYSSIYTQLDLKTDKWGSLWNNGRGGGHLHGHAFQFYNTSKNLIPDLCSALQCW